MLLCCMKTIKDVFNLYKQSLNELYDTKETEAITLIVISEISGFSKARIKAFPELELSYQQTENLNHILTQLKTGKPIQYILGKTEFYGLSFKVSPSVLIPRPETEELVEWVITSVGSRRLAAGNGQWAVGSILDIGTGSGCIAISLKKHLTDFKVSAIDISADAVQTAKENAKLNDVEVDFSEGDILNPKLSIRNSKFEFIISNPPYVTLLDKTKMHTNVTDFEPHTALFVPQEDPLIFYKAIADFAVVNLFPNGQLFFEINESYGEEIVQLLAEKGFKNIELRKDMSERDRFIRAMV
jgi:release factor glutamine methyltransferase